jgi:transcriptional regulator CtsR
MNNKTDKEMIKRTKNSISENHIQTIIKDIFHSGILLNTNGYLLTTILGKEKISYFRNSNYSKN